MLVTVVTIIYLLYFWNIYKAGSEKIEKGNFTGMG